MKKTLKVAFLYVGTIIGAGFSSGREIALFFQDLAPYNVALSAVFMSLFALLFLSAGKLGLIPKGKLTSALIFFSASISLVAMLAGGEYVMREVTGVPLLCLFMALLGAVVVCLGIEKIKIINSILVPLIVICIAVIFFKIPHLTGDGTFSILRPIAYGGLDVLLGGIAVSKEGESMTFKQIFGASAVVCVFLAAMLYMLQTIVLYDTNGSLMPVFAISKHLHLQLICGVLIASAIFTTLVSSLKIASDKLALFCSSFTRFAPLSTNDNRAILVLFLLVVFYPLSFLGFDKIVDTLYPVNSILGVLLALVIFVNLIVFLARNKRRKPPMPRRTKSARQQKKDFAKPQSPCKRIDFFQSSSPSSFLGGLKNSSNGERRESSSSSSSPFKNL